jgi:hypothetical protein
MIDPEIRRELRMLKGYAVFITALVAFLAVGLFQRSSFGEISVGRINVVEPDGKLRMVIANRPRSIGPIYKGEPFGYPGGSRPGMVFFNDEGTENGGLTLEGRRNPDGTVSALTHMSFDQFDQDQVLTFETADKNGLRRTGITIDDRAPINIRDLVAQRDSIGRMTDTAARTRALEQLVAPRNGVPLAARRLFVGRTNARDAMVELSDPNGHPRLRLKVDSLGAATMEFLDETGKVTAKFP